MIRERFSQFLLLFYNADSPPCRDYLMQSYITQLGNFWARQRRSLVGGGGRQQVSHRWALHLLCIPSPCTVCLSVSSPQTQGNLRISSFFQLFPSFPVQLSRWLFFFFYRRRLPLRSSPSHMGPLWEPLQWQAAGGQTCSYFTVLSQRATQAAANEGGLGGGFWGVGGRGQTVSVSLSPPTL